MKQSPQTNSFRDSDTFLRTIAICFVVLIHFLSSYKISPFVTGAENQTLAVSLDQLGRMAVPLFVALSGYGLMEKYKNSVFSWGEFLKKRVFQLLPLYVLWSYIYWFIFLYVPQWRPTSELKPFFGQLLYGNADYHLYFVPMIFQLYLLFPLLSAVIKKHPKVMLLLACIFQASFYWIITSKMTPQPGTSFFQSDQKQYQWAFTWIFYFVLGMSLGPILGQMKKSILVTILIFTTLIVSGYWVVYSALQAINSGVDPLVALRFTRLEVMVYASSCIVTLFALVKNASRIPKSLLFLGKHSYVMYLSHTLLLRLIFMFINQPAP